MSRGLTLEQMEFLVSKGISAEEMLAFAKMGASKSKGAERTARWRAKKDANVTKSVTRDVTCDASPPPNDIYSNPPEPLSSNEDIPPLPERVIKAWNDGPAKAGATACRALDASRRKQLSVRVREHGESAVFEAIEHLRRSEFHCGQNDRGWTASLGWLLESPRNFMKALELQTRDPPSTVTDSLIDKILAQKSRAA